MNNLDIRQRLKETNVKQWQVADRLVISEMSLVRKLRYELTEAEKQKILSIINELAIENNNNNM